MIFWIPRPQRSHVGGPRSSALSPRDGPYSADYAVGWCPGRGLGVLPGVLCILVFQGSLEFLGKMKFPKSPPQSSKKYELAPGSFFCSGPTYNLLDSSAAALGKHLAPLPRGYRVHSFSLEFLGIPRISLENAYFNYPKFPPARSKNKEQWNSNTKQARPHPYFASKNIKIRPVGPENELLGHA